MTSRSPLLHFQVHTPENEARPTTLLPLKFDLVNKVTSLCFSSPTSLFLCLDFDAALPLCFECISVALQHHLQAWHIYCNVLCILLCFIKKKKKDNGFIIKTGYQTGNMAIFPSGQFRYCSIRKNYGLLCLKLFRLAKS